MLRGWAGGFAGAAALLALLVLVSCGIAPPGDRRGEGAASGPAAPPAGAGPAATPTLGLGLFANPVIRRDFPDPDTLRVGDTYYVYATNTRGTNVQIARSKDLVRWEPLKDALPVLPGWSRAGFTWAPEVTATGDGSGYVMYFTARHSASGRQCIGVATSGAPEGPFKAAGDGPLICQVDEGGSIDAASFVDDDGSRYVLWKNDGNCCRLASWISIQPVSGDGLALEGTPTRLIRADESWEGSLVEAPTLWKHGGKYYLFYSANAYAGERYAVGYAVAEAVTGPYRKARRPLLATSAQHGPVIGPGGQDVVATPDGRTWMLYHAWESERRTTRYRSLNLDELVWADGVPVVKGPNRVPQRAP